MLVASDAVALPRGEVVHGSGLVVGLVLKMAETLSFRFPCLVALKAGMLDLLELVAWRVGITGLKDLVALGLILKVALGPVVLKPDSTHLIDVMALTVDEGALLGLVVLKSASTFQIDLMALTFDNHALLGSVV